MKEVDPSSVTAMATQGKRCFRTRFDRRTARDLPASHGQTGGLALTAQLTAEHGWRFERTHPRASTGPSA